MPQKYLFPDDWVVCWYYDFGINRYRVVVMTHQTLSLGKYWKLFSATLNCLKKWYRSYRVYVYNMWYPDNFNEALYSKQCRDTWGTGPWLFNYSSADKLKLKWVIHVMTVLELFNFAITHVCHCLRKIVTFLLDV